MLFLALLGGERAASAGAGDPIVVGNSGSARWTIPIEVPPGPGGFEPNLALTYSSSTGDGPFGVGWSLGLPEIRCSARHGVPNFSNCQEYELGGTLLVPGAEAGRYHTVVESFQRIRHLSGGPAGTWWTVEQPNGTKLYFGQAATHQVRQGGYTARWLLQWMVDAFGNSIRFDYGTAGGEVTLESVAYGNSYGNIGLRQIDFFYDDRPDPRLSFAGGIEQPLTQRLREIQVTANGAIYRRYVVEYDLPGVAYSTARSRLSWVQEFGTDCTGDDPIADCPGKGLPPRTFRYRDANDSGGGSQWSGQQDHDAYRIPFGDYAGEGRVITKPGNAQLIGDINGDGRPDWVQLTAASSFDVAYPALYLNTGTGFSGQGAVATAYRDSFASLEYDQPRLVFEQIRAHVPNTTVNEFQTGWYENGGSYAMCSLTRTTRRARLAQELYTRGAEAESTTLAQLHASGSNPSPGWFEPRPSVKLVDLDADGRADLVVSTRLHGARQSFDCNAPSQPLAEPGLIFDETITIVFRNTGSGWERDDTLASGLPPLEEILVKSSYQTEIDEPSRYWLIDTGSGFYADSSCANRSVWGFEQWYDEYGEEPMTPVCHNFIDLAPEFTDFNGDGYPDLAVLERDDPNSFWTGIDEGAFNHPASPRAYPARTHVWIQKPGASPRWQRAPEYDLPFGISFGSLGFAHAGLTHLPDGASFPCWS